MDSYFGESGLLSGILSGYEPRPEQAEMSEAIAAALRNKEHIIAEAGTGVGKSLAYLVPLIEWVLTSEDQEDSGQRRAVVSTYTKALQKQLVEKDLPFLRDKVFKGMRFALCIGSENYVCLRRLRQAKNYSLFDLDEAAQSDNLFKWVDRTSSGIRSEVDISYKLWQKVCRESDVCYGRECRYFNDCFYQKAKAEERRAHILIANHHLFFAHVASGWNVLPSFGPVVFDEAHELEDVAADYLGVEVSNYRLRNLLDAILSPQEKGLVVRLGWLHPPLYREIFMIVDSARKDGEAFFSTLAGKLEGASTLRIHEKGFVSKDLADSITRLSEELKIIRESSNNEEEEKEITALILRCEAFSLSLRFIIDQELENHVYWVEKDNKRLRFVATPLDVAAILRTNVFDVVSPAILTSATLATGEGFGYIQERLGLPGARTLLLHSPFDYKKQALLYVPSDIGEPKSEFFEGDIINRINDILNITRGRTLVLFTSYGLLLKVYNSITVPGLRLLMQGEMDSYRLLQEFRREEHAVLCGTYTFWQGIDVPGEDLQCVIITKLPFAVPDEPVIEARLEALNREGRNPFYHYQIPEAAILLKQGFGRLIRTKTDKGVVVILDSRLRTKGYGMQFIKSLPGCKITASMDDVGRFIGMKETFATIGG